MHEHQEDHGHPQDECCDKTDTLPEEGGRRHDKDGVPSRHPGQADFGPRRAGAVRRHAGRRCGMEARQGGGRKGRACRCGGRHQRGLHQNTSGQGGRGEAVSQGLGRR